MTKHQKLKKYNPKSDQQLPDGSYDLNEPDTLDIDPAEYKTEYESSSIRYGGSGDWKQPVSIKIYSAEDSWDGDYLLECSVLINGVSTVFYSILSSIDQWGTYHSFRITDEESTYAQEWGNPSFLKALGEAMIKLAELTEPDPQEYVNRFKKST